MTESKKWSISSFPGRDEAGREFLDVYPLDGRDDFVRVQGTVKLATAHRIAGSEELLAAARALDNLIYNSSLFPEVAAAVKRVHNAMLDCEPPKPPTRRERLRQVLRGRVDVSVVDETLDDVERICDEEPAMTVGRTT